MDFKVSAGVLLFAFGGERFAVGVDVFTPDNGSVMAAALLANNDPTSVTPNENFRDFMSSYFKPRR